MLKILRYGDTGALVALLREGLIRAGWDPGAVDGIFGSGTQQALRSFQRTAGLVADAVAGPATQAALRP